MGAQLDSGLRLVVQRDSKVEVSECTQSPIDVNYITLDWRPQETLACMWVSSLSSPNIPVWTHPVHMGSHTRCLCLTDQERDRRLKEVPMARFCHWCENTGPLFDPSACFLPAWYVHAHICMHTCVRTYIHLSLVHACIQCMLPTHVWCTCEGYMCVHMCVC